MKQNKWTVYLRIILPHLIAGGCLGYTIALYAMGDHNTMGWWALGSCFLITMAIIDDARHNYHYALFTYYKKAQGENVEKG